MQRPLKIISGGQAGADMGGLIGARQVGIATGGTAPKGFRTELGDQAQELSDYGLVEHVKKNYQGRTRQNIVDADATLIFATVTDSPGTRLTIDLCQELCKPYLVVDPQEDCTQNIRDFLQQTEPSILNIAGNRESKSTGIEARTVELVAAVFAS